MTAANASGTADRLAIIEVVNQVATSADRRDWTTCRAAFTDTIELDHDTGAAAEAEADDVIDGWRRIWGGFSVTFHAVTNHEIEVGADGDQARCRSHVAALHVAAGTITGENAYTTHGFYDDHLTRTPRGWKIRSRRYRQVFESGNKEIFTNPVRDVRASDVATVHTYFRLQQEQDLRAWIALWSDDGAQAIPYAPEGFPALVSGRSELQAIYQALFDGYDELTITGLRVDPLHDPGRVLARWHTHADLAGGGTYDNDLIGLFEFNQYGKLRFLTEYFNPTAFRAIASA